MLLASHAALAMAAARTEAGLLAAMDNRDLIGQAIGILIERYKITGCRHSGCWPPPPRPRTENCGTWPGTWSPPGNC